MKRRTIYDTIRALAMLLIMALVSMLYITKATTPAIPADAKPEKTQEACVKPAANVPEVKTLEIVPIHIIRKSPAETNVEAPAQPEPEPQWISYGTYTLTAYCSCEICCGYWATTRPIDENGNPIIYTASGARAEAGTTIAVDPTVIPYGTKVKINDHIYTAHDTGGAIKGNRIDVYFDSHADAWNFGMQHAEVFILQEG